MTSARLNKTIREDLEKDLIKKAFSDRATKIYLARRKMADRIYTNGFKLSDRKLMDSLPDGWLPTQRSFTVNVAGQKMNFYFCGREYFNSKWSNLVPKEIRKDEPKILPRRFPEKVTNQTCEFSLPANDKLAVQILTLIDEQQDLEKEITKLKTQICATLKSVATVKRLLEVWPEVKPFVEDLIDVTPGSAQALALPIDSLNTSIGLQTVSAN